MTGKWHIQAVGQEPVQEAPDEAAENAVEEPILLEDEWIAEEDEFEPAPGTRWIDRLIPATAITAMVAWTGFFAWTFRNDILTGSTSQQWIGWIINWTVPMLLISIFWLLSMRNSRREAQRFGDTAQMLRQESHALEERLGAVNRELSLAREFLGSQSRELDSLGRIASERISAHASELQSLIQNNGAQVNEIASVSDTALVNMTKLRDDLPVIANSARDVSNQVGQAGRTAHEQLEHLVSGFERLNQFGKASERQVSALSGKIGTTLAGFETQLQNVEQAARARFASLSEQSDTFRVELESREVDALAAMRKRSDNLRQSVISMAEELADQETAQIGHLQMRLDTLREGSADVTSSFSQAQDDALDKLRAKKSEFQEEITEVVSRLDQLDQQAINASRDRVKALHVEATDFDDRIASRNARFEEEMARRQNGLETREAQASEVLAQRLTELDDMLAERSEAQSERLEKLVAHGTDVSSKLEELNSLLSSISEQAEATQNVLDAGTTGFGERVTSLRGELDASGQTIGELTESGIRLLEIIQSGAREARDTLPAAVDKASARLGEIEQQAVALRQSVDTAHERSVGLSDYVIAASEGLSKADEQVASLSDRLADTSSESLTRISNLRGALGALSEESDRVGAQVSENLQSAISELERAAQNAFAAIESGSGERLEALASEIGAKASAAIERSLRSEGDAAVERLEEASTRANDTARATTANLRDQLVKVNELAGNLEERVSRAREQAHEQVDNDFARRMALITESLNSNAIDIAKGLSQDVSDTAWAAYLKGDRGIFARRTVKLLDNVESREIMDLFEADHDFREHVNRYIHDFEAMLRNVLSTRDGNALGVTLLSSDIGKLYVALAQSIERLRE